MVKMVEASIIVFHSSLSILSSQVYILTKKTQVILVRDKFELNGSFGLSNKVTVMMQVVNIEWGNFCSELLPRTFADEGLDADSLNPGQQVRKKKFSQKLSQASRSFHFFEDLPCASYVFHYYEA